MQSSTPTPPSSPPLPLGACVGPRTRAGPLPAPQPPSVSLCKLRNGAPSHQHPLPQLQHRSADVYRDRGPSGGRSSMAAPLCAGRGCLAGRMGAGVCSYRLQPYHRGGTVREKHVCEEKHVKRVYCVGVFGASMLCLCELRVYGKTKLHTVGVTQLGTQHQHINVAVVTSNGCGKSAMIHVSICHCQVMLHCW